MKKILTRDEIWEKTPFQREAIIANAALEIFYKRESKCKIYFSPNILIRAAGLSKMYIYNSTTPAAASIETLLFSPEFIEAIVATGRKEGVYFCLAENVVTGQKRHPDNLLFFEEVFLLMRKIVEYIPAQRWDNLYSLYLSHLPNFALVEELPDDDSIKRKTRTRNSTAGAIRSNE